ncbi:SDR family NAD(P)-dependent oxidoreductase [Ferrovibrio sp.]|uniref:SDR family NAD(P)-dependent oxidoreductase n=1 Tax=Ferrovibrio sp. TaxID=1917215 RepID=UPI003D2A3028
MRDDPFSLTGKRALITGGTRGIGHAIAARFYATGAQVILSGRRQDDCDRAASAIGPGVKGAAADLADPTQVVALCHRAIELLGGIDVLVLNGAVVSHFGPLAKLEESAFDLMLTANVKSSLTLCRHLVPPMAERGDGAIVIVGSTSGLIGEAKLGGYALTKAAEMQLVRNLAVEYGPSGVRANAIAPGLVRTDMTRAIWSKPERLEPVLKTTALRRMAEPEDIAAIAQFLASGASRIMTGQTVIADAGMTINLSTP